MNPECTVFFYIKPSGRVLLEYRAFGTSNDRQPSRFRRLVFFQVTPWVPTYSWSCLGLLGHLDSCEACKNTRNRHPLRLSSAPEHTTMGCRLYGSSIGRRSDDSVAVSG